jgi:hypothetical protein
VCVFVFVCFVFSLSHKHAYTISPSVSHTHSYFHTNKEVYSLKNLEKGCSKQTGITMMTIKEVLQSLVDDNLVDFDKIGSG